MRWLVLTLAIPASASAQATLTLGQTSLGPPLRVGLGVNGGGGWYNFVGANLVGDPSFEGAADGNGFAADGWPYYTSGTLTASIDTGDFVSGKQSQRIDVTGAPASMAQGRVELPQEPLIMTARAGHTYRLRAKIRSSIPGSHIRLAVIDGGWALQRGPPVAVTGSWATYTWDYTPAAEHLLRGTAVAFDDAASYWIDDFVAWDTNDYDADTGLSATYVARLAELAPATLRLGGLGVNGIPLEEYLRRWWDLDYGPPALQPDFDLVTYFRLCLRVGAQPFLTVPPAFSDDASWQIGDLTDSVIDTVYEDHGNFVDYIGGDDLTVYGARREADGFPRWDLLFDDIYFELGNEVWGTPNDKWDMDPNGGESQQAQMTNYATYCNRRMTDMRGRPGWRSNMHVGFGGRSPDTWIGGWGGSYDGTLVPAIGDLCDFSTIDLYYGNGDAADTDAAIYGALFANAPMHERQIGAMRQAFRTANGGVALETAVYEGNAAWGPYEPDLSNPSALYHREVSLGAAVSLLDVYAASHRAGVRVNNHFHYGGNIWGATGGYPSVPRKPAFLALELLNTKIEGDAVSCAVAGAATYDEPLTGENDVPYVACYAFLDAGTYRLLLINRHLTQEQTVSIDLALAPVERTRLWNADINANNDTVETVTLETTALAGELVQPVVETLAPHSGEVLVLSDTPVVGGDDGGPTEPDGGPVESDGGPVGGDASAGDDGGALNDRDPQVTGECGCHGGEAASALALLGVAALWRSRRRS